MSPVLTIRFEPWQLPRPKKLSLRHMPYEIRHQIYEFTLIEHRLLKKAHKATCPHRQRQTDEVEAAPLFCKDMMTTHDDLLTCRCGKRTGLALLQTCRQIFLEASPVFWSGNTLQFFSMAELVHMVGETLRAEQRSHIRSLSLLNLGDIPESFGSPLRGPRNRQVSPLNRAFWTLVGQCGGLARLEIPPYALHGVFELDFTEQAACGGQRLLSGSRLSSVKVTQLIPFGKTPYWMPQTTVARCSRCVSLQDVSTLNDVNETRRELEYNFRVHVDTLVKTRFLGATPSNLAGWKRTFRLDPGLRRGDNVRHVVLPNGQRTKIEFYGLPISTATRVRIAKGRMALDSAQKGINGLSVAQHEVVQLEKEKRKAAQLRRDVQERNEYEEKLVERRLRRLQLKDGQRADAKDRQRDILRAIVEAAEVRSRERKRVHPRAKEACAQP
ncbi:hypothetical protein E4U41_000787 [Claviceps citrina]|nr:hypothetical protein E4U41_000787 [Claviceps citrina]